MFPFRKNDPRQKPIEKGRVVHSTETPLPSELMRVAMRKEAVASVALDGETQVIGDSPTDDGAGGLPRTSVPKPTKEKPVARGRRSKLPFGRKWADVNDATELLEAEGRKVITAASVFDIMSVDTRRNWTRAFGTNTQTKSAINATLWSNSVNSSNRTNMVKLHKGDNLGDYVIVSNKGVLKPVTTTADVVWDKVEKATNGRPKVTSAPSPFVEVYTQIGTDMQGQPLFFDNGQGIVGYMEFVPLEGTE